MADFLLSVGVDVGVSYSQMQKDISGLVSQLNSNPPKIKVALEIDNAALKNIREQVAQLSSMSTSKAGTVSVGAADVEGIRKTASAWRALDKAMKQAAETAKSTEGVVNRTSASTGKEAAQIKMFEKNSTEYYNALKQVNTLLTQVTQNQAKWTAAKNGKSSAAYNDLNTYAEELRNLAQRLIDGSISVDEFKNKMASIGSNVKTASASIKDAGENTRSWSERITSLAGKFSTWFSITRVIMAVVRTIKQMVSASKEIDSAMAQLKIVTGAADSQMTAFLTNSTQLAKELGKSITDVLSSVETFSRLGYNLTDATDLAKYANILSNVADVDTATATTGLTSIIKGYNMEASDAEHVADVLVEVGQKYAISAEELMEAFQRGGAALAASNTDFEKSAALFAATNASLQNAQSVGTMWKTVSARIRGAVTELEELGEDTEGLADGLSKYREELQMLSGVDIMLDENTYKDMYTIFVELAEVWDSLASDKARARVAEILGGTRQLSGIMSTITNIKDAMGAYESAMDSAGEAARANDIYMDTIDARIQQVKASFQELSTTLINSDFLKFWVSAGAVLLGTINSIVSAFGGLGRAIAVIGGTVAALNLTKTIAMVEKIGKTIRNFVKIQWAGVINSSFINGFKAIPAGLKMITSGSKEAAAAFTALGGASAIATAGLTTLVAVIGIAIIAYQKLKQYEDEKRQKAIEAADAAADSSASIAELTDKYLQLSEEVKTNAVAKDSLISTEDELIDKLGIEKSRLEELIQEYGNYADAIRAASNEKLKEDERDLRAGLTAKEKNALDAAKPHFMPTPGDMNYIKAYWSGKDAEINQNAMKALVEAGYASYSNYTSSGMNLWMPDMDLTTIEGLISAHDRLGKMLDIVEAKAGSDNKVWQGLYTQYNKCAASIDDYKDGVSALNQTLAQQYINQSQIGQGAIKTQRDFEQYRQSIIDAALASDEFAGGAGDISEAIDYMLSQDSQFTAFMSKLKQSGSVVSKTQTGIDNIKKSFKETRDAIQKDAEDKGVDLSTRAKTIFGNINTNNRQILEWTNDNLLKYKDALMSWAEDGQSWDDVRKEFENSFSTVFGSSNEFDGVEIAFSPMLQTENGAVLLDSNTVNEYIWGLIDKAGEGWTSEDLLRLDTEGLEFDGQQIKNLIADIGDTAMHTAEAMHFVGKDGAFQTAEREFEEFANWIDNLSDNDKEIVYDISLTKDTAEWSLDEWNNELQELKSNTDALDILKAKAEAVSDVARGTINFDIKTQSTGLENLQSAIGESISAIGMTDNAIAQITDRYGQLANFDAAKLFEKTANGIHLNATELRALEAEYEKVNKTYLNTALDEQVERYNKLTERIESCADAQERASLIAQQGLLGIQIEETATLTAQYEGLTSAYQKWVDAQSTGNEGDMYDNITSGLKDMKELYDKGLVGTDDFRAAAQLMTNFDISNWDVSDIMKAYENGYPLMKRYFTEGQEGCIAFLSDVSKLNSEWAHMNEDGKWEINFGKGGDQDVADTLGISVDAVQALLRKMSDYGIEIDLDSVLSELGLLEDKLSGANEKLKELEKTDVDFNFNLTSVDEVKKQITSATNLLDEFRKEDGTVDLSLEGAEEAQVILAALIQRKQELDKPAVMNVNTANAQTDIETVIAALQTFQTNYNKLEVDTAIGVDPTAAQEKVDAALDAVSQSSPEILTALGIDATSTETLLASIEALSPELMVQAGVDPTLVEEYDPDDKDAEVKYSVNHKLVDEWNPPEKKGVAVYKPKIEDDYTLPTLTGGTAKYKVSVEGSVGARGTAFSGGSWGARKSGIALGGELGQELVVRDGRFFTIGDDGAEFFRYKKDDIIFNADQTKQIFEKGKITVGNRRGTALAEGTAFSSGSGTFYKAGKPNTTKYVSNSSKSTSSSKSSSSSSSSKSSKEESEFERQYKYHQHLLNMEQESVEAYLDWLVDAYKRAYEAGQIELDDFYKYEEEVYSKSKDLFEDYLNDISHEIEMLEHHGAYTDDIVAMYKEMQESVHQQAEYYRSLGIAENSDTIQDLQKKWWEYFDNIKDKIVESYDDIISHSENLISFNEIWLNNAVSEGDYGKVKEYSNNIIAEYKKMQDTVHQQAEYYRSLGYADTSDEVAELSRLWWDYQDSIVEAASSGFQALVDSANDALDEIEAVYSTLTDAAQEYADSGFISPDTLQSILDNGVKYLAMLEDENGQLVINEKNIQNIIKARTQQVGIETALNYIQQLRTALTNNDTAALNDLLYVTEALTGSTWDLVYAELASLNLTESQFKAAVTRIDTIRALSDNAISGIGKLSNQVLDRLNTTADALSSILEYTIAMIKQEVENKIDALEEEISDYKKIISLQKESLQVTKEQDNYNKSVADKIKEIAELQSRINQLSLDDSREAQAERKSLEEDLAKLQEDLADTQADHAYEATVDSLDKMVDAYEEEKNEEIEILENSISSYQKLYDLAIERIRSSGSNLLGELLNWNEEYGNDLNETIIQAWKDASAALSEYRYNYERTIKATQKAIDSSESGTSTVVGKTYSSDSDSSSYTTQQINSIVSKMKANSAAWGSSNNRQALENENQQLGRQLNALGLNAVYDSNSGTWYLNKIGGTLLYDVYPKYHQGGVAGGGNSLKDNEVLSILEKGELILDQQKKNSLYEYIDISTYMLERFGAVIDKMSGLINRRPIEGSFDSLSKDVANGVLDIKEKDASYVIEKLEVTAPIQVTEKLDKAEIRRHAQTIGEISADYIEEGFTKRGIKSTTRRL